MASIIEFLSDQFRNNQFFTAAVLAAPAAMVTYSLRATPRALWHTLKRAVSVELRFNSDMDEYFRVQEYVMDQLVYTPLSRNFGYRFESGHGHHPFSSSEEERSYVSVGYGNHVGRWRGRPVWITRSMEASSTTDRFKESLEIMMLGRGMGAVRQFLKELDSYIKDQTKGSKIQLYSNSYDGWNRITVLQPRPISTVVTNNNQAEQALRHIQQFEASRQHYVERGTPYHTGILLTGPHGTGKSSLIRALATEAKRNLFYLNLAGIKEESQLTQLMSYRGGWENGMLVLEDIDVSGGSTDRENEGTITLSTLLNTLDGLLSPMGMITLATTNALSSLDPALVRPGRFDLVLHMTELQLEAFRRMAGLYGLPPARIDALSKVYRPTSGSQLRMLLENEIPLTLERYYGGLDSAVDAAA